jgi:hypothetical protein
MNVLAIVHNSCIEKHLVEGGYFPESATTTSWKEDAEMVAFDFTGVFIRARHMLERLEDGSCHVGMPRYKFASHDQSADLGGLFKSRKASLISQDMLQSDMWLHIL